MPPTSEAQVQALQALLSEAKILKSNLTTVQPFLTRVLDNITTFDKMFAQVDLQTLAAVMCVETSTGPGSINQVLHEVHTKPTPKAPATPPPSIPQSKAAMFR